MTTRRGAIIGSVRTADDAAAHAVGQLVAGGHVAGVDALDVEGAQPSSTSSSNSRRERRLLDVVLALQQVEGIRAARCDLLADGGSGLATGIRPENVLRTPRESR